MNEKQKQFFENLQRNLEGGAVQPEELIKVSDTILSIIKTNKLDAEKLISGLSESVDSELSDLKSLLNSKESRLIDTIQEVAKDQNNSIEKKYNKLSGEIKKLLEIIPLETDLSDIEDKIEQIRREIPTIPEQKELKPEELRDLLQSLTGEARFDASAIKNLPQGVKEIIQHVGFPETQLKAGSNVTVRKDASGAWVIASTATGGGGGHTIEDEGTPLTQRTKLNFVGAGVTVTDDSGNDATVVTINGGGGSGDVTKVGTPVDNQIGVWTGDGTIEGDVDLTFDKATNTLGVGLVGLDGTVQVHAVKSDASAGLLIEAANGTDISLLGVGNTANATHYGVHQFPTGGVQIGSSVPFADAAGTLTLQNVDALDATTEATIEAAIDTLANLTSIQGFTLTLADAGADAILGWDDSAGAYENLTQAEVLAVIGDASDTAKGVVELAIASEVTTGTDTARAVTPDAFAGSDYGKRVVNILVSDPLGSAITTGDGKACFRVPSVMNGWNLVGVAGSLSTVSSSGLPTFQVRRSRRSTATTRSDADMLSTKLSIDASEFDSIDATTAVVIDTANDDVNTGDNIYIDIDVAGTGAKGLVAELIFQLP